MNQLSIHVDGLHCGGCAKKATRALNAVHAISGAQVDLPDVGRVSFEGDAPIEAMRAALVDVGLVLRLVDAPASLPAETSDPSGSEPVNEPIEDDLTVDEPVLDELAGDLMRVSLPVLGMTCASCVGSVEAGLKGVAGVQSSYVNLAAGRATILLEHPVSLDELRHAIVDAGYRSPEVKDGEAQLHVADQDRARELKKLSVALWWALPPSAVVLILAMTPMVWSGFPVDPLVSGWVQAALTTLVLFGPGRRYIVAIFKAIQRVRGDMHTLVGLGTGAAWAWSLGALGYSTWTGGVVPEVYFESAAVIVAMVLLGNALEARARGRASQALRELLAMAPETALLASGAEVAVADVVPDDLLRVRAGERVPVDGLVVEGRSELDCSIVTGESLPVGVAPGDEVLGGTLNGGGVLVVRATHVGSESALARVVRMVEQAQGSRAPIQKLADQVSAVFVPVVLGLAVLTFGVWWVLGAGVSGALMYAVAVLVIACPCALGIATPTAVLVGTGRGARMGVLLRDAASLQRAEKIDVVVLDKTGTITQGRPEVVDVRCVDASKDEVLARAAAVETGSAHPLAKAILSTMPKVVAAADVEQFPGLGVSGDVEGQRVWLGNSRFMVDRGLGDGAWAHDLGVDGRTVVYVGWDGAVRGAIALADTVKDDSAKAIATMRGLGLRVVMLTGDSQGSANVIAAEVGIDEVIAEAMPEDKLAFVADLQAAGHVVGFVGDGVNDAPALALADVGFAMGTGAPVANEAAPVSLPAGKLSSVVDTLLLARSTMRIIRQNLGFAFMYNIIGIPLAAGVLAPFGLALSPMIAGTAMALSSVSVVTNSLRLRLQPLGR